MTSFHNPLARRGPRVPGQTAIIKQWAREVLGLADDVLVSVNELACSEPGCPPRETVILLLPEAAPTSKLSIHKALVDVQRQDVVTAVKEAETELDSAPPLTRSGALRRP